MQSLVPLASAVAACGCRQAPGGAWCGASQTCCRILADALQRGCEPILYGEARRVGSPRLREGARTPGSTPCLALPPGCHLAAMGRRVMAVRFSATLVRDVPDQCALRRLTPSPPTGSCGPDSGAGSDSTAWLVWCRAGSTRVPSCASYSAGGWCHIGEGPAPIPGACPSAPSAGVFGLRCQHPPTWTTNGCEPCARRLQGTYQAAFPGPLARQFLRRRRAVAERGSCDRHALGLGIPLG